MTGSAVAGRLRDFLFHIQPEPRKNPFLERIRLAVFYAVAGISLVAGAFNLDLILRQGRLVPAASVAGFMVLMAAGVGVFWATRLLGRAQIPFTLAILLLMTEMIVDAGGAVGFGLLYFLAGFPVMYLLFGFRTGIALAVYFCAATAVRLLMGGFHADSIFRIGGIVPRTIAVVGVGTLLGIIVNISLERLVSHLSRLALEDQTTRLPNRFKLEECLREAFARTGGTGGGFAVVGIKILGYNKINAMLGTRRGDDILRLIGQRLADCAGGDRVNGRWSGSLFMTLPDTADHAETETLCRNILTRLSQPYVLANRTVYITFSLAVCRCPEDAASPEQAIGNVLSLLDGGQCLPGEVAFFNEANLLREQFRFAVIEALNHSDLDRDFRLVYQPKVRLADGVCIGAEVLIRWDHARMRTVSPGDFIPLAEQTGFIRILTRWVINRVLADVCRVDACHEGPGGRLVFAINLSVMDLKDREFTGFLEEGLGHWGCSPADIEFELTEGMLVDDDPQILRSLQRINELGFRIAIDDFGTGYSSLSYLHRMKVQNLKIDQSFVRRIGAAGEETVFPVVDAIISMGSSLGLEVTAEGVETPVQAAYLRERGCHTAQGWLYSPGLDFDRFLDYLGTR